MSEHLVNNSRSNTPQHLTNSDLFGRACRAAMTQIRKGGTSLEAVAAAIAVLEVKEHSINISLCSKSVAYSMYVKSRMIPLLIQGLDQI